MYLSNFLALLRRRWFVTVPAAIVTVGLAAAAYLTAPSEYRATGSVILLKQVEADDPENPYLDLDDGLSVMAGATPRMMVAPDMKERLLAAGASANYELGNGSSGPSPIVNIVGTAATAEQASRTVELVASAVQDEWNRRQEAVGAPESSWVRVDQLTPSSAPELQIASKARAVVAALLVGSLLTVGAVVLADRLDERPGQRHSGDVAAVIGVPEAGRTRQLARSAREP